MSFSWSSFVDLPTALSTGWRACFFHGLATCIFMSWLLLGYLWLLSSNIVWYNCFWRDHHFQNFSRSVTQQTSIHCKLDLLFQVSDYPGGIAVVYGGFSRLVSYMQQSSVCLWITCICKTVGPEINTSSGLVFSNASCIQCTCCLLLNLQQTYLCRYKIHHQFSYIQVDVYVLNKKIFARIFTSTFLQRKLSVAKFRNGVCIVQADRI